MTIKEANTPVDCRVSGIVREKGLKQLFVAEKAGLTAQELNDMLNGRRLIKICDIPRIANALEVDANYLFGIEKGEG
mgnify:FL=1